MDGSAAVQALGVRAVFVGYGGFTLGNRVLAVRRGWLLAKVFAARICPVDIAVALDPLYAWFRSVAGCSFLGRVVEAGIDAASEFSGRTVAVRGYTPSFTPPLNADGFASEYAAAPPDVLAIVSEHLADNPLLLLLPDVCIALEAATLAAQKSATGRIMVYGAGPSGVLAASALADSGYDADVVPVSEQGRRLALDAGTRVYDKPPDAPYDVYLVFAPPTRLTARRPASSVTVVLHPHITALGYHPRLDITRYVREVTVRTAYGLEPPLESCLRTLKKLSWLLEKHLGVMDWPCTPPTTAPPVGVVMRFSGARASP